MTKHLLDTPANCYLWLDHGKVLHLRKLDDGSIWYTILTGEGGGTAIPYGILPAKRIGDLGKKINKWLKLGV